MRKHENRTAVAVYVCIAVLAAACRNQSPVETPVLGAGVYRNVRVRCNGKELTDQALVVRPGEVLSFEVTFECEHVDPVVAVLKIVKGSGENEITLNSQSGTASETGGVNSLKIELSAPPDEYAECLVRVIDASRVVICEGRLSVMAQ